VSSQWFLAFGVKGLIMSGPEDVLREIERQASRRWLPIIGAEKARIVAGVVEEAKPIRALEVGANIGYSAIVIASHMPEDSHLTTIEVDRAHAREAEANIKKARLAGRVSVLVGDALKLIPSVDGPIDLAFVDAEKDEYGRYLVLIEPKLRPGSVIIADNVCAFSRAMADYLDRVRRSGLYESRYVSVGCDGLEISRRLSPA
jgi:predicted O-methyltransferase YrrM